MRRIVPSLAALLIASQALAQGMPQGGGPPGGAPGGPGGGPPGGAPAGMSRPREMKPIKREAFDKAVAEMFRSADTDRSGIVTLEEFQGILRVRLDKVIRARFEKVDGDRDGAVSLAEFVTWQQQMGAAAMSEVQPLTDRGRFIPQTIAAELGNDPEDRALGMLIEPLSAMTIVKANTNYDAGMSLDELLAYQRKPFDAADTDADGRLSMQELRSLRRDGGGRNQDGPPGNPDWPEGGPPPCPPGTNC